MRIVKNRYSLTAIGLAALSSAIAPAANAAVTLLGVGGFSGSASDKSGLTGTYTPGGSNMKNQLGSFGSGIAYTGSGDRYVAVNDRGFANGTVHYDDRLQLIDIKVDAATGTVTPTLVKTILLRDENGRRFDGFAGAFDAADPAKSLRLDPEAARVTPGGDVFVSDEYGPYIYEFDPSGKRIRTLGVPAKFGIAHPSADGDLEISGNASGRVSNKGMEGLAISPDGKNLYGIMQSPLLQDNAVTATGKKNGVNNRILVYDLTDDSTKEYLYPQDDKGNGVNEILAVNEHQFLVIERDSKSGGEAAFKKIFLIDTARATDISGIASLPAGAAPAGVTTVEKSLFINLLDPKYGLAGADFPEKIEGLAFGPDLPNGEHQLIITNDNDLISAHPSNFYVFTFDSADLNVQPQRIDTPFAP